MSAVCMQKYVFNKIIIEILGGFVYNDRVVVSATR